VAAFLLADGGVSGDMARSPKQTRMYSAFSDCLRLRCVLGGQSSDLEAKARQFHVLKSRAFRERWNLYGLARTKRVPAEFWALSDEQISLFLNRFCLRWLGYVH